jgi:protein phosphatase
LECLTRDHTQRTDRTTNYLSRAVGADPYLEVDMHTREINVGDIFVLSCDSIHEFNPAAEKPARHQTSFL